MRDLPAGYLERCPKNLGTYEFCHSGEQARTGRTV